MSLNETVPRPKMAGESEWKSSLRKQRIHLRTGIIVANVLPALRTHLLLPTEFARVAEKSSNADRVDELVGILLTKDESSFDDFCLALETNGYPYWAGKLRGKGT